MHYEVIVIGMGSMGAAACYQLARAGVKVLGLEQFEIPNSLGSHHGQSRIIRKAYFEHPDYVPLLEQAYRNWSALEALTGSSVFLRTGLLYMGRPDQLLLKGSKASAAQYGIPLVQIPASDIHERYPQLVLPGDFEVLFETDAGLVMPERAVLLYTEEAIRLGADVRTNTAVTGWRREGSGYLVDTCNGPVYAEKLVITAGPYAKKILPSVAGSLSVTRQAVAWVIPKNHQAYQLGRFPCWTLAEQDVPGIYYGFPILPAGSHGGPIGFKLAHHAPGEPCDPDTVSRTIHEADEAALKRVLQTYFRDAYQSTHVVRTCLYTNTPDEDFIIDYLPGYEGDVAIAAGFSGHGFKFASAVGEILADLVLKGNTSSPITFLSAARLYKGKRQPSKPNP
jgi:sarcosine oxidase